jgi:hypothetical protein
MSEIHGPDIAVLPENRAQAEPVRKPGQGIRMCNPFCPVKA